MRLQNLHTHTSYCDGRDTPAEMVRGAIEQGFSSIGFSGHIYLPFPQDYAMTHEATLAYQRDIKALKEQYKESFPIFMGIELDLYSDDDTSAYDYVIGSSHYTEKNGELFAVDLSFDTVKQDIREAFGGDAFAYARSYYEGVVRLSRERAFDFVGHFDLLTKYRDREDLFDTDSPRYRNLALEALHAVKEKQDVFEINTGAISRGYRVTPYPDPFLLREMKEIGARIVLTSDCHDVRNLTCGFDACYELLRAHGFRSVLYLTSHGWEEEGL